MKSLFTKSVRFLILSLFIVTAGLSEAKEFYVTSGDVTLWVSSVGESDNVLVLISGGPGSSSDYLESIQTLAWARRRIVRFDMRGTGKSSAPKSDADYTPQHYVQDLAAVQKALGVKRIDILGYSFGGLTAMNYAAAYPNQVNSVLLYGSAPTTRTHFDATDVYGVVQKAMISAGVLEENPQEGTYEYHRKSWAPQFSDPYFKLTDDMIKTSFSDSVYELTMAAFGDFDFRADVAKIKLPVLIVAGEDDPFEMGFAATVRTLKKDLANSKPEVHLIPKCGHLYQECKSKAFRTIRRFLRNH